jgi:pSer/pThr/pTyr-binding forkhead associated (FHA) protein
MRKPVLRDLFNLEKTWDLSSLVDDGEGGIFTIGRVGGGCDIELGDEKTIRRTREVRRESQGNQSQATEPKIDPAETVSAYHADIQYSHDGKIGDFYIIDQGSTNGTSVAGRKVLVNKPELVRPGEIIKLGRYGLCFEYEEITGENAT